jgi:hypothetical protein
VLGKFSAEHLSGGHFTDNLVSRELRQRCLILATDYFWLAEHPSCLSARHRARYLASVSRVRVCGRSAARYAVSLLGTGRSLVSSLAGISSLLCHAPANRFDLHSLRTDHSAASAILLMVRYSAAFLDLRRRATGGGPMLGRRSVSSNTPANRYEGITGSSYRSNPQQLT